MLIGRHDVEGLMRVDPASVYLPNSAGQSVLDNSGTDAETVEVEIEMSDLLLNLRPIRQVSTLSNSFLMKLVGSDLFIYKLSSVSSLFVK